MKKASFQTRARAIDHLGRGQIADAPTAISELWKNAYDAYARNVELHIFETTSSCACILDNGHGMNIDNLLDKWLVIGTDSKIGEAAPAHEDTFGLPLRVRQGEKGIGRLSAGFLGPVTLVVSKEEHSLYSVLLVDWRFFENPYLFIDDVTFPVYEVATLKEVHDLMPRMGVELLKSITEADQRVQDSWRKFDQLERQHGDAPTTRERILDFDYANALNLASLGWWNEVLKNTPEADRHGTALYSFDVGPELSNWLEGDLETAEQAAVRGMMRDTLISFVDPLEQKNYYFDYGVYVHAANKPIRTVIESKDAFTLEDFLEFEHYIIGECDEKGVFRGKVRAFGLDVQDVVVVPRDYITEKNTRSKLGAFKLRLATYEQEINSSSHPPEQFRKFESYDRFAGITLHRDGLRVMPYGREGADLFNVEGRRSKNAGRYFYSYRRTFGGISFSSKENPNLKDKAGREGLVDNKARRTLVTLVSTIMVELADLYFGRKSPQRGNMLAKAKKINAARQKAAEALKKRTKKSFRSFLKQATPKAMSGARDAQVYIGNINSAVQSNNVELLFSLRESAAQLDALRDDLKLPMKPFADDEFEDAYRSYRDAYADFCYQIEQLKEQIAELEIKGIFGTPKEIIHSHFYSNQSKLSAQISKLRGQLTAQTSKISERWEMHARDDAKKYHAELKDILTEKVTFESLSLALNKLDSEYLRFRDDFELKYSPIINVLEQIEDSIDLEGAWLHTERENADLQKKVNMLHSTAQLGITVEIVGHELESMETQIDIHLRRFPPEVKALNAYRLTIESVKALTDRLRFLMPLKKSAYRSRISISGREIGKYLQNFFGNSFEAVRTEFSISENFKNFSITDLPARIYPTFINIVHNALYWVQFSRENVPRKIVLDRIGALVIIADTGPGVDQDDIERIFELFYSRRVVGRGIGLYLCKQNLAGAGHLLRYAGDDDPKVLDGANFVIELKGAIYDN